MSSLDLLQKRFAGLAIADKLETLSPHQIVNLNELTREDVEWLYTGMEAYYLTYVLRWTWEDIDSLFDLEPHKVREQLKERFPPPTEEQRQEAVRWAVKHRRLNEGSGGG